MFSRMIYLVFLVIGVGIGITATYLNFHTHYQKKLDNHEMLENILKHSSSLISDENYACDGKLVKTVGSVVASLLELNAMNQINMLTYGCFNDTCTMSVSNCKPWQDQECSTRFLKYNIDKSNKIKLNTFSCFDMP